MCPHPPETEGKSDLAKNWSLQSHDGPCSNCRVRKIKCGREKPECSICRQAQVECVYTPPPKRVNHVKVL